MMALKITFLPFFFNSCRNILKIARLVTRDGY